MNTKLKIYFKLFLFVSIIICTSTIIATDNSNKSDCTCCGVEIEDQGKCTECQANCPCEQCGCCCIDGSCPCEGACDNICPGSCKKCRTCKVCECKCLCCKAPSHGNDLCSKCVRKGCAVCKRCVICCKCKCVCCGQIGNGIDSKTHKCSFCYDLCPCPIHGCYKTCSCGCDCDRCPSHDPRISNAGKCDHCVNCQECHKCKAHYCPGHGGDNGGEPPPPPTPPVDAYVDLTIYDYGKIEIEDDYEYNPGLFMRLNCDDDNENGIIDKNESSEFSEEDDLIFVYLYVNPGTQSGNVKIERSNSKIKLYKPDFDEDGKIKRKKGDAILRNNDSKSYDIEDFEADIEGWCLMEGYEAGITELEISFDGEDDRAKITVCGPVIQKNGIDITDVIEVWAGER